MYNPITTYRIQFNKDFTLKDFEKQIGYLRELGIGTLYASPIFAATPGSAHGYDVTDPLVLNPEITTMEAFRRVGDQLAEKDIGWMQDIVSNHMAFHPGNRWLMDVLEKGLLSQYHNVFDMEPGVPSQDHRLMIPFLGDSLEEVLEQKQIVLGWREGTFTVDYYDNVYPVNFETTRHIFRKEMKKAPVSFTDFWKQNKLEKAIPDKDFLNTTWEGVKQGLSELQKQDKQVARFIRNIMKEYSGQQELMREVIHRQYYELCHWQETERRINYRRFFTVNGLICLRMEDPQVFDRYHALISQLVNEGYVEALRIDHIDGLKDPNNYLKNLRELSGRQTYIVAEKILEYDEEMPDFWPIQGNTGYDFLATVNNLFTSVANYEKLRGLYRMVTHVKDSPSDLIYQNKKMILTSRMHGEWDNLFNYFNQLEFVDYEQEDLGPEEIKEAIGEFMLACPVYRLYPRRFPLRNDNRRAVEEIFDMARRRNPPLENALNRLAQVLLTRTEETEVHNDKAGLFFSRLMQFTGPLMAKGVEDTSMYQYNCFIAHNEVGDAINARGITNQEFHRQMQYRLEHWPLSMNTTATHDTKRGEDVRARLNIISVLTGEWEQLVNQWLQMNQKLKIRLEQGLLEPSHSVEYFVYQTLLGTFPFSGKADEHYMQRIDEYLVKALREAKRKVSWRDPDEAYESTVCEFTRNILDPEHEFLASFVPFQQKVAWRGVVNSLSQLTLKCTCPGVADIYQGRELWDLTLVDPDNRQPVDYAARHKLLGQLKARHSKSPMKMIRELMQEPFNGHVKLWLTYVLLQERRRDPGLFLEGSYIALETRGALQNHVLAFAREHQGTWLVVLVPLLTRDFGAKPQGEFLPEIPWEDTRLVLPAQAPAKWKNLLSERELDAREEILVSDLFQDASVGLMKNI